MPNDAAAIRAAAQIYLDGLYEGDADKLASVFHPTSGTDLGGERRPHAAASRPVARSRAQPAVGKGARARSAR